MSTTLVSPTVGTPPPQLPITELIRQYRLVRDYKSAMVEQQKKALAKPNQALAKLEAMLLEAMQKEGGESVRTGDGTAYTYLQVTHKVTDWPSLLGFIRDGERWDMLVRNVSKEGLEAAMNDGSSEPVPGVETRTELRVGVRKPTGEDA